MTRLFARALGCAIFGALAGAAAMILLSGLNPRFTLEMTQNRPGLLRGFYPGERDGDLTFAWTTERAEMPLAGLDRNVPWTARIRVRGGRRDPATLPILTVFADDRPVATRQTTNTFEEFEATIPSRTGHVRGVTLALAVSNTFVPGPDDSRALGVQIDRIAVEPQTVGAFPPRRTVAAAALGSAVFGAIFGLLAATATTAVGAATLLAVGQAAVLRLGLGPFAPWLTRVEVLAASIGISLLVIALVIERWRHERLRHTARFALMFTGSALYLHLLVLLHPDKLLADAPWHVSQLSTLAEGFLVSPIVLYAAALPFVHVVADRASLLWILAAAVEAISFLFFYWMIVRGTGDRVMAAVAVAVLQLMPLGFQVLAEAGLATVLGRALSIATMTMATGAVLDRRPWQFAATLAALLLTFLSDPGSFGALSVTLAFAAVLLATRGSPETRRLGLGMGLVLLAAVTVAVPFESGEFMTHAMALPDAGTLLNQAPGVLRRPISCYGGPFLVLAGFGLVVTVRARRAAPHPDWWLLFWGWFCLTAFALIVDTALPGPDLQGYFAAMPPLAMLAARGLTTLWYAGSRQRALAVIGAGLGAAVGVVAWLGVLAPSLQ